MNFLLMALFMIACSDDEYLENTDLNEAQTTLSSRSLEKFPTYSITDLFETITLDTTDQLTAERYLYGLQAYSDWYTTILWLINKNPIANIYRGVISGAHFIAAYQPLSNTIIIYGTEWLTEAVFKEEIIHASQDRIYPGGIYQYAKAPGTPNIEFEDRLVQDIICIKEDGYYSPLEPEAPIDYYTLWIEGICAFPGNINIFPSVQSILNAKISNDKGEEMGFYEFCEIYGKKYPQYDYPVLYDLTPMLIKLL